MFLIMSSLTLQPNLFHEFQPMGGVSARSAEGEACSCPQSGRTRRGVRKSVIRNNKAARRLVFMHTFYQNYPRIGTGLVDCEPDSRPARPDPIYNSGLLRSRASSRLAEDPHAPTSRDCGDFVDVCFLFERGRTRAKSQRAGGNIPGPRRCGHSAPRRLGRL